MFVCVRAHMCVYHLVMCINNSLPHLSLLNMNSQKWQILSYNCDRETYSYPQRMIYLLRKVDRVSNGQSQTFYFLLSLHANLNSSTFHNNIIVSKWPLTAVEVLFSPMASGWASGRPDRYCPGCILQTVRYGKYIFGAGID